MKFMFLKLKNRLKNIESICKIHDLRLVWPISEGQVLSAYSVTFGLNADSKEIFRKY